MPDGRRRSPAFSAAKIRPLLRPVVQPVLDRLERHEQLLLDMRAALDIQFKRTAQIQAQLDKLIATLTFTGKRDGDTVRFNITDDIFAPYAMVERIAGVGDMGYSGTATGTIDHNGKIVAIFDGQYRLGYGQGPVLCAATDHRIEVTPAS